MRYFIILIGIILLGILTSCVNSEFNDNYKQFKDSYIVATDFVDKDKDSLNALKKLDINALENEFKKMKIVINKMDTNANTKDEKGIYANIKSYYQGLEFLLYAAKNVDKLTVEEKRKVYTEIILASMNRDNMRKK